MPSVTTSNTIDAFMQSADGAAARTALGLGTASTLNAPATGNASTSQAVKGDDTRLSDSRTPTAHTHTASNVTDFSTAVDARITAVKGAANGVCPLGSDSKVASAYLPSYVDDVLEFANLAAFPATGETGKIYVALDTNKTHRWSGSAYVEISPSPGSTDSLTEGTVNLYFTTARAQTAQVQPDWNASSGKGQILNKPAIPAATKVEVFATVGTFSWTKPENLKQISVELVSGGNGGGAGGKGVSGTAVYGGSGGGAGGYSRTLIDAADLTESTYQVVVGAGGAGGQPGIAGQGGTIGAGFVGGSSSFAPNSTPTLFLARAQSGGTPGQPGGATAPATGTGGAPNSNAGGTASIGATAGAGSGSANAPTGGGAGGGTSTAPQAFNGGNGATNPFISTFSAGGGGSTVANGGSATPATTRTAPSLVINGSGGGGGGASIAAGGSGGNGANGSGYGSGGGGGGATTGSGSGGNGGNGAQGVVVITSYF